MKGISKNILWVIVVFLAASLVFSLVMKFQSEEPTKLTLNEVAQKIKQGQVNSIKVSGNNLNIELKGGEKATSKKEIDSSLTETLKNYGVSSQALRKVSFKFRKESGFKYWASILIPTILPLIIIIAIFWWMFRRAQGGMNQAFNFGQADLKMFSPTQDTKVKFDDVAGLEEEKEELKEVVEFLKDPHRFLNMGAKIPTGVLLVGPPGTGKTLMARAVAGESKVPFFHITASSLVEMFVGVGASRVRDIFETAKNAAPSIVFIDEIDAVGRKRGAGVGGGNDEREQTLNQILSEMDGFEKDTKVIVIAATNRPDILDKALLRPGRFDRQVQFGMPDINEREKILEIHSDEKPLSEEIDLRQVAVRTPGFSGADLENLLNEAAIKAAREDHEKITQDDILSSIEKVMLGPEKTSKVISEEEKKITAFHEAGHALVAAGLDQADPVQKVTIVSRGGAGGYTIKLPTEERQLKKKSEFMAELAVALGGYTSETLEFGEITTGSSNDIQKATKLAKKLVTQYGMSEKLGPRSFGDSNDSVFLGEEIAQQKDYSEEVAAEIDEEVDNVIQKALNVAEKIISENKELLDKLAQNLIEKETLEKEDFEKLVEESGLEKIDLTEE
ncbi:MAG: ATP-dependent zinc metalloprotease FtsH [Candidatus Magasanikbacteria bacterium]